MPKSLFAALVVIALIVSTSGQRLARRPANAQSCRGRSTCYQIVTEEMEKVTYAPGLGQPIVQHDFLPLSIPDKWGYREADTLFVDAILAGQTPPVTAADGYKAVELVEACYLSAPHDGERLRLPL